MPQAYPHMASFYRQVLYLLWYLFIIASTSSQTAARPAYVFCTNHNVSSEEFVRILVGRVASVGKGICRACAGEAREQARSLRGDLGTEERGNRP